MDDAVGSPEIANDAVGSPEIANDAVGSSEIANGAVQSSELGGNSVGAAKAKDVYAAVSGGVSPAANTFADQTATCSGSDRVLGGGFSWASDAAVTMLYSTPDPLAGPNTWIVRGRSATAGNTLFAWATCLPV